MVMLKSRSLSYCKGCWKSIKTSSCCNYSSAQRVLSRSTLDEPMDPSNYLHLKGVLIYLTKARPDIQTAVSFGAMHLVNLTRGRL